MRRLLLISILSLLILAVILLVATISMVKMPGRSFDETPPSLSEDEAHILDRLRKHVHALAGEIGERNEHTYDELEQARRYIEEQLRRSGYTVEVHPFEFDGKSFYNVEAILPGARNSAPSIVVGAHYDSVQGCPGANDNATGVAALLELAQYFHGRNLPVTLRFVAFANEEPPYFNTMEGMGSVEYVRRMKKRAIQVTAMLSLETIGYYSDAEGSQYYPPPVGFLYPNRGNFIAFVGNFRSRRLVKAAIRAFREKATIPSEGIAAPALIPGLSWSDHRSFWQAGVPALMVTDTAIFRDPAYHRATDTPDRLDYERMARVVIGLRYSLESLTSE